MKRLFLAILALIGFVGVLLAQPACFPISPVGGSPGSGGSIASGGAGLGGGHGSVVLGGGGDV